MLAREQVVECLLGLIEGKGPVNERIESKLLSVQERVESLEVDL